MRKTEQISPRYKGLDLWPDTEVLAAFWEGQLRALAGVGPALPSIAAAAGAIADHLQQGEGRLIYGGAGSSGMLAVQDGIEMTPTFGWPAARLLLLRAGDEAGISQSGAPEDDARAAENALAKHRVASPDVVIGVAASGTTPYTVSLIEGAGMAGALTVGIANNSDTPLLQAAAHPIFVPTGPEVIAGSTRLNAGTAQKAVLGMLSSLVMIRLGHVVDGLMVSLVADNEKLRVRAARIVSEISGAAREAAEAALRETDGRVKNAVLVAGGATARQARDLLAAHGENLREAMADLDRAG